MTNNYLFGTFFYLKKKKRRRRRRLVDFAGELIKLSVVAAAGDVISAIFIGA